MDQVRWGIIGCGNVTEVKSGPAFYKCNNSKLVAVMRRDAKKAKEYASRHNVKHSFDSIDALLACDEINAVYIATPPGSHAELAYQVLDKGLPTYIEKPIATTIEDADNLCEQYSKNNVPLFVAYYRRALPRFLKIKAIIESGKLGDITGFNINYVSPAGMISDQQDLPWRFNRKLAGGGLFVDLGSHILDIADYLFGPLQLEASNVSKVGKVSYDVENRVDALLSAPNSINGVSQWNFYSTAYRDEFIIQGTLGSLKFSTFGDGEITLQGKAKCERFHISNPPHIQQPLIQNICNALVNGENPLSTGITAARTTRIMTEILMPYYQ